VPPKRFRFLERAAADAEQALGLDHPVTVQTLDALATGYLVLGRLDEAFATSLRSVEAGRRTLPPGDQRLAAALSNFAGIVQRRDGAAAALPYAEEIANTWDAIDPRSFRVGQAYTQLGNIRMDAGDLDGARLAFEHAVEVLEASLGPEAYDTALARGNLGVLANRAGAHEEGLRRATETLAIVEARVGPEDPRITTSLQQLSMALRELGRPDEAWPHLQRAAELRRAVTDRSLQGEIAFQLGLTAWARGHRDEARTWVRTAQEHYLASTRPEGPALREIRRWLRAHGGRERRARP
jgi:eukaryotic-like serine/threonine-protein kinase